MTAEPTTPRRALTGLPPRRPVETDPAVSRLRREHRQTAAVPVVVVNEPQAPIRTDAAPGPQHGDGDLPRYLQLTRKEARIREDQADRLAGEVRRLNQARKHRSGPSGERITDNTLIRVAIDLLLARADNLTGTTEAELRDSVTQ